MVKTVVTIQCDKDSKLPQPHHLTMICNSQTSASFAKRFIALVAIAACGAVSLTATTPDQYQGFEGSNYSPFQAEVCCGNVATNDWPSFGARKGSKALRIKWHEKYYTGSRTTRGVEMKGTRSNRECWYGLSMFIENGRFPTNKWQGIIQLIGWHPACETNKTVIFDVESNSHVTASGFFDNEGASNNGTVEGVRTFQTTLTTWMPKGRWIDVVIYARYSKWGSGVIRIWWDGAGKCCPTYQKYAINLADGCWVAGQDRHTYGVYPKFGVYAFDVANYTKWETREIWFDEVAYLDDKNPWDGWESVDP